MYLRLCLCSLLVCTSVWCEDEKLFEGTITVDNLSTCKAPELPLGKTGHLLGTGLVEGSVDNQRGCVTLGDPLGGLHIVGDYTQGNKGSIVVKLWSGEHQCSTLSVGGAADLSGSLYVVPDDDPVSPNGTYSILTADELNGGFTNVVAPYRGTSFELMYSNGVVFLREYPALKDNQSFTAVAESRVEIDTANALDELMCVTNNPDVLPFLQTYCALEDEEKQVCLSSLGHDAIYFLPTLNAFHLLLNNNDWDAHYLTLRLRDNSFDPNRLYLQGPSPNRLVCDLKETPVPPLQVSPYSMCQVFMRGSVSLGAFAPFVQQIPFDVLQQDVSLGGACVAFADNMVGIALTGHHTELKTVDYKIRGRSVGGHWFYQHLFHPLFCNFSITGEYGPYQIQKSIEVSDYKRSIKGHCMASLLDAHCQVGTTLELDTYLYLEPSMSFDYQWLNWNQYTEQSNSPLVMESPYMYSSLHGTQGGLCLVYASSHTVLFGKVNYFYYAKNDACTAYWRGTSLPIPLSVSEVVPSGFLIQVGSEQRITPFGYLRGNGQVLGNQDSLWAQFSLELSWLI